MEFSEVMRRRKMTRRFLPSPIAGDTIDRLLEASLRAPSAGSTEGVDLLVCTSSADRSRFWSAIAEPDWLSSSNALELSAAPVVVVVLCDPGRYIDRYHEPDKAGSFLYLLGQDEWPIPYWIVDASFIAHGLLLGATDAGLGALFFQLQGRESALLEAFEVPSRMLAIGAVAIGHEAPATRERTLRRRRTSTEVLHHGHW